MRVWAIVTAAVLALLVGGGVAVAALVGGRPEPAEAWSPPAQGGAGPVDVQLSAAARRHPRAPEVKVQLRTHYVAINLRDHEGWRRTVDRRRIQLLPTAESFVAAYGSTQDGSMLVDRIDTEDDGSLTVRIRFVSVQDPVDAPAQLPVDRICWRSTLPMATTGYDRPRITLTGSGSSLITGC